MGSRLEGNSAAVRKRIEGHNFDNEEGEEYEPSKFGGFPEYFRRKKIKLQNLDAQLRAENDDKPQVFRGIVAHVNGYTQPSLNDLHVLIVSHGGGFIQYLDGKTQATHIIASNLTPKKVEEFKRYRIVKPAWIVDSVSAGKLLPWENYRVVDEGTKQKLLRFDDGNITSQVNHKPVGYKEQSDTSWYTKQLAEQTKVQGSCNADRQGESLDENDFPSSTILSEEGTSSKQSSGQAKGSSDVVDPTLEAHRSAAHVDYPTSVSNPNKVPSAALQPTSAQYAGISDFGTESDDALLEDDEALHLMHRDQHDPSVLQAPSELGAVDDHVQNVDALEKNNKSPSPRSEKKAQMTAEDHNKELLSDPRIRRSSVLNPDFLEQYYRESRLHHLSTWKADLKSQLQALTAEKTASQTSKQKRAPNARRYILHVDFDSFFVAVSLKNQPHLQDKPAVVAHGAGTGSEIASCNYAARKYGVKNGMWMKRAQEMCDDLKVLPYDFPAYEAASRLFYDAIMDTGGIVQSVSIDEALLDVSVQCHAAGGSNGTGVHEGSMWREQAKADEIAQAVRDRVKRDSGCAVSVGIGNNILLAKVALRKAKPAGQHQIKPEEVLGFIGELEVQGLPGVAYSIGGKLEEISVKFVKDIRELNKERLVSVLGPKTGEKIWNYSRGIDRTEVGDQVIRKSVSAEVNWGVRFENQGQAEEFMTSLSAELSRRLIKEGVRGRHLTMKVMRRSKDAPLDPPKFLGHGKCDIHNKSVVLGVLTNDKATINKETLSVLRGFGFSPGELRGLGIQMTKLEPVKPSVPGNLDGSQRRLQFNVAPAQFNDTKLPRTNAEEALTAPDKPAETPPLRVDAATISEHARPSSHFQLGTQDKAADNNIEPILDDIQDDPETPKRSRLQQAGGVRQMAVDSPSRKPLNTLGTQFIMPTQVDPQVLAELPPDIRAKLGKYIPQAKKQQSLNLPQEQSQSPSRRPFAFTALPSESQIDPSILDALPEDVRKEILSQLQKSPSKPHTHRGQAVLPQSPRKNRTVKANMTVRGRTRGRPRGGSLLARLKGAASRSSTTLTQANFVAAQLDSEGDANSANIAPEFLEALPEDVRAEVIENHKREQLKRTGGIEVSRRRRNIQTARGGRGDHHDQQNGERVLRLEARPPRPTFTPHKLSQFSELREAISSWHEEFEQDGPYQEDVEALCKYLRSVVLEESNMRKAVGVVQWLSYITKPLDEVERTSWSKSVDDVRRAVDESVQSRGLGAVDYDL